MAVKQKPTYKGIIRTCTLVLFFGALLLAYLMATREMAPPRKYVVDMKGDIIGVDNTPKPVVVEKDTVTEKEEVKPTIKPKKEESKVEIEEETQAEDLIVPSVPEGNTTTATPQVVTPKPEITVPKPEITAPKVEKVE